ncbi:MAG TPA: hypothetical protein VIY47_03510, partial [Ignavibacteriaceae bacterium]
ASASGLNTVEVLFTYDNAKPNEAEILNVKKGKNGEFLLSKSPLTCNVNINFEDQSLKVGFPNAMKVLGPELVQSFVKRHELEHCRSFSDPKFVDMSQEMNVAMLQQSDTHSFLSKDSWDTYSKIGLPQIVSAMTPKLVQENSIMASMVPPNSSEEEIEQAIKDLKEKFSSFSSFSKNAQETRMGSYQTLLGEAYADVSGILIEVGESTGYTNALGDITDVSKYSEFLKKLELASTSIAEDRKNGFEISALGPSGFSEHQTSFSLEALSSVVTPDSSIFDIASKATKIGMSKMMEDQGFSAPKGWSKTESMSFNGPKM